MTILRMLARKQSLTDNCGTQRVAVTVAVAHVNATSSVSGQLPLAATDGVSARRHARHREASRPPRPP
jgi:hypothetical protein